MPVYELAGLTSALDIAVNLTDPMYQGTYHGKLKHPCKLLNVSLPD